MGCKLTCRDAGGGSSDLILELPDDLLDASGGAGDILNLEQDPTNGQAIQLSKIVLCEVCDASTAETGHGTLHAQRRNGETDDMKLCRSCFDYAMITLKRACWANHMFDEDPETNA